MLLKWRFSPCINHITSKSCMQLETTAKTQVLFWVIETMMGGSWVAVLASTLGESAVRYLAPTARSSNP